MNRLGDEVNPIHADAGLIFKRNTPQLAAVGMKGMRIQLGLVSA